MHTISPVFRKRLPIEFDFYGTALANYWSELCEIPWTSGASKLEDFADSRSIYLQLGYDEADAPESVWFLSEVGLSAVRTIMQFIDLNPDYVADPDWLLAELCDLEDLLLVAVETGSEFHLEPVA